MRPECGRAPIIWMPALLAALSLGACSAPHQPRWPADNRLVVALESAPSHLDPRLGTDQAADRLYNLLYAGLFRKAPDGALEPDLAERYEVLDGGRRYRFHLRPGVRFHDGRSLCAADVAWTLGSILEDRVSSPKKGVLHAVERVVVIDPQTVDLLLHAPFGSLLVELTESLGIVPAGTTPEQSSRSPLGCGPFRLLRQAPDRYELAAFDGYHRGRPHLDRVIVRVVPDATVRALELLKGSVQLVVNDLPPDLVPMFRANPAFQVSENPGANYSYVGINLEDPALADRRVRRALALALDRQRLVATLWRGLGTVTETMLPPGLWARHDALAPLPHDPAAASALLEEAGFRDPDGPGPLPRLRLSLKTSTSEIAVLQAQVLQQMVAQAGIELDVRSFEFATFYDDVRRGAFQLFTLVRTGIIDPNIYSFVLHSASLPPRGQNRGRYRNPQLDRLLDTAAGLSDQDARRPLYLAAQELIAEDLPYISLFTRSNVAVMARPLSGYRNYLGGDLTSLAEMRWRAAGESP